MGAFFAFGDTMANIPTPLQYCQQLLITTTDELPTEENWKIIRSNLKIVASEERELQRRRSLPDPDPNGPPY